ncbi:hypothetical protein [Metabacillus fastidiosus]|uniref:hypothetical protein n=1 Tax=Metabacillus fastidiosus TaxID=1458 RepID=UPI003D281BA6
MAKIKFILLFVKIMEIDLEIEPFKQLLTELRKELVFQISNTGFTTQSCCHAFRGWNDSKRNSRKTQT